MAKIKIDQLAAVDIARAKKDTPGLGRGFLINPLRVRVNRLNIKTLEHYHGLVIKV